MATSSSSATRRLSREQAQAETRSRIEQAAFAVIAERGYDSASVAEIADRAGYTVGAIYSNFDSKRALLDALLDRAFEPGERERGATSLREFLSAVEEQFTELASFVPPAALLADEIRLLALRGDVDLRRKVVQLHERRIERFATNLSAWYAADRLTPPEDPTRLARGLLALGEGLARQARLVPGSVSGPVARELVARLLDIRFAPEEAAVHPR